MTPAPVRLLLFALGLFCGLLLAPSLIAAGLAKAARR